jgi:hypothetical protein
MKGGALLPTVAFAIPGSAAMAILLGAFQMQGLEPGPRMLTERLDVTFSLVWTLAIANVLGAALLLAWGKHVARITFISGHYIVPLVILFMFMGAWIGSSNIGDWISLMAFGILGWLMKMGGWPRPPLVLGYILGKIMENALQIGVQTNGWHFIARPITLIILALALIAFLGAVFRGRRADPSESIIRQQEPGEGRPSPVQELGEGYGSRVGVSLLVGTMLSGAFLYALWEATTMPAAARFFPLVIILPTLAVVAVAFVVDTMEAARRRRLAMTTGADEGNRDLIVGTMFTLWLIGIVVATLVIGQYLALVGFVLLYLTVWARAGWRVVIIYTAACALMLYVLFDQLVPVAWYESPFFRLFS